jgi:hypothetical protein
MPLSGMSGSLLPPLNLLVVRAEDVVVVVVKVAVLVERAVVKVAEPEERAEVEEEVAGDARIQLRTKLTLTTPLLSLRFKQLSDLALSSPERVSGKICFSCARFNCVTV